jgi:anaerobic ribonucleoside-triphosphate reductase activating protein
LNYANIKYFDIANGVGVRTSLFVSGCTHHCENCFNSIAWDFNYGNAFTEEVINNIIDSCEPYYIAGLSLLGGEPMEVTNQKALLPLVKKFKDKIPNKTIWCYSGYTFEELTDESNERCHSDITEELLSYIDVLVDGKFVQELKDITLKFRGSSNQRLIDLNKTRAENKIVLWQDDPIFENNKIL